LNFQGTRIVDLAAGSVATGLYILKQKELRKAQSGKLFVNMDFSDKTGTVNAKIWDATPELFDGLQVNKIYYVKGRVDLWNGVLQLTVDKYKMAEPEIQEKIEDFVPSAPEKPEEMLAYIEQCVESFENDDLRLLVRYFLETNKEKLLYWPAAKSLHHAVRSGLLYHIKRMLMNAQGVANVYEGINKDLLFAGIILHDMDKLNELESNTLGMADYTVEGQLLGHIPMGILSIQRMSDDLSIDPEITLMLQHMILTHHGIPEYGSPKPPMIIEAEILHLLDLMDARIYDFTESLQNVEPGEFSEPVWSMDKRRLYKHKI
jgi:3'-5' exoribonuclease